MQLDHILKVYYALYLPVSAGSASRDRYKLAAELCSLSEMRQVTKVILSHGLAGTAAGAVPAAAASPRSRLPLLGVPGAGGASGSEPLGQCWRAERWPPQPRDSSGCGENKGSFSSSLAVVVEEHRSHPEPRWPQSGPPGSETPLALLVGTGKLAPTAGPISLPSLNSLSRTRTRRNQG